MRKKNAQNAVSLKINQMGLRVFLLPRPATRTIHTPMSKKKPVAALIVAAGRGTRAGGTRPKQWQPLSAEPSTQTSSARVIDHAIAAFRNLTCHIAVVHHADDADLAAQLKDVICIEGGANRSDSVRAGLEALSGLGLTHVLIHDAARALTPPQVIKGVLGALKFYDGAAPALPITDALWRGDTEVSGTQDRSGLFRAQTPQGFDYKTIRAAHRAFKGIAADDVEVARAAQIDVAITQGSEENFKITHPEDFARASQILALRQTEQKDTTPMDIRLGNGYDVHRFGEGDHVWLCGVKVAHTRSLQGHSDADVGMHALTDALYGALAEGDIGQHFPPSDMQWKGAESHIFLQHAIELARSKGYELGNCDVTLICERPKIGPHADEMRAALAQIMSVSKDHVSVKATTSERLGFTGREEGIASLATATLIKT
jgi:2-C-methyl-D-erythritol 4-phosphate cytidylyltransferase/2-C-methyl-D-erythritol 2,4-cyclodiphosphate synthase